MGASRKRRYWRWLVASALVVGALVLVLRETDEDRIRARLRQVSGAVRIDADADSAARRARIERAFAEAFAAEASVTIPDLPVARGGREGLVEAAAALGQSYREVEISFEHLGVELGPSGQEAKVQALVSVAARAPEQGLLTDTRDAHIRLRKADGRWQVTSAEVAPPTDEEPEARP